MNHSSFAAWCRKAGAYETPKYNYRDWNAELLEPIAEDITKIWKLFDERLHKSREHCFNTLALLLDGIRDDLGGKQKHSTTEAPEK